MRALCGLLLLASGRVPRVPALRRLPNLTLCDGRPQYALALFGGMSRLQSDAEGLEGGAFDLDESQFINVSIVGNSVKRHIVEANGGARNVKVFIHSWAYPLAQRLLSIYEPTLSRFEDQRGRHGQMKTRVRMTHKVGGYNPWSGAGASLSIQESLGLVRRYEEECNHVFDKVVLYRPDVLLWGKDMVLSKYDGNRVTANGHGPKGAGDFHWVLSSANARRFRPFDSIKPSVRLYFGWIRDYTSQSVTPGVSAIGDDFHPCRNQEVFRKIERCYRANHRFSRKDADYLGITDDLAGKMGLVK